MLQLATSGQNEYLTMKSSMINHFPFPCMQLSARARSPYHSPAERKHGRSVSAQPLSDSDVNQLDSLAYNHTYFNIINNYKKQYRREQKNTWKKKQLEYLTTASDRHCHKRVSSVTSWNKVFVNNIEVQQRNIQVHQTCNVIRGGVLKYFCTF